MATTKTDYMTFVGAGKDPTVVDLVQGAPQSTGPSNKTEVVSARNRETRALS